jgi:hypothetical protein
MMITDPIDLADRLYKLLQARMPNGSFVVKKQHRDTVIEAELLLRELFRR